MGGLLVLSALNIAVFELKCRVTGYKVPRIKLFWANDDACEDTLFIDDPKSTDTTATSS